MCYNREIEGIVMTHIKRYIIFFLILLLGILLFLFINQKQLQRMKEVASSMYSTLNNRVKCVESSVKYLHLSVVKVLKHQEYYSGIKLFKVCGKNGNYTYTNIPTQNLSKAKIGLIGWSADGNYTRYFTEQKALFSLADNFRLISQEHPIFAWVYYFSKHQFSMVYPYVSTDDFPFTPELEKEPFFRDATPKYNPQGKLFFTPLYQDSIGKGLMVTIGKPVYVAGKFMGTVDIDIPLNHLDNLLFKLDNLHNTTFIYNTKLQILGSNNLIKDFNRSMIYKASDYLQLPEIAKDDFSDTIQYSDGKYIYTNKMQDAPFTFVYFQSAYSIWFTSMVYVLAILLLIVFLPIACIKCYRLK